MFDKKDMKPLVLGFIGGVATLSALLMQDNVLRKHTKNKIQSGVDYMKKKYKDNIKDADDIMLGEDIEEELVEEHKSHGKSNRQS